MEVLPDGLHGVERDGLVASDDGHPFFLGVRNEKTVERIAVDVGEPFQPLDGGRTNREDANVSLDALFLDFGDGQTKPKLSKSLLDSDLPKRCHARIEIGLEPNDAGRLLRQLRGSGQEKYEDVRVEEEAHHIYSANSSRGASKSGAM